MCLDVQVHYLSPSTSPDKDFSFFKQLARGAVAAYRVVSLSVDVDAKRTYYYASASALPSLSSYHQSRTEQRNRQRMYEY